MVKIIKIAKRSNLSKIAKVVKNCQNVVQVMFPCTLIKCIKVQVYTVALCVPKSKGV